MKRYMFVMIVLNILVGMGLILTGCRDPFDPHPWTIGKDEKK
jgi:hypothetical protein